MMGRVDSYGQVTYRRNEILQGLRDYVVNQTGKPISKEEKIEETPELLRHACVECKVSQLGVCYFTVPEMNLSVPFYFCTACGKLYYLKDFM